MKCVRGTLLRGVNFTGPERLSHHGFNDSDSARDFWDRKSDSACVFKMAGGLLSWCSRKETVVATFAPVNLNTWVYVRPTRRQCGFVDSTYITLREYTNTMLVYSDGHNAINFSTTRKLTVRTSTSALHSTSLETLYSKKEWSWNINQQIKWLLIYSPTLLDVLSLRVS